MDTSDMQRLMAMLQAHALAISALIATHPEPNQLRRAIATLDEKIPLEMNQEAALLYRATIATFQKALPR